MINFISGILLVNIFICENTFLRYAALPSKSEISRQIRYQLYIGQPAEQAKF
jgi:hypothetical protein